MTADEAKTLAKLQALRANGSSGGWRRKRKHPRTESNPGLVVTALG